MTKLKLKTPILPTPSPQERFFAEAVHASLLNDDFMRVFFKLDGLKENGCLCTTHILRILTGIKDLKVKSLICQADLQAPDGGHAVRLDVLAYDTQGTPYDIELQRAGSLEDITLRAYYNRAMLAVRSLDPGKPYPDIRQHYVIFITERDLLKLGKALYEVGDPPIIGTGVTVKFPGHIIIANASYKGDDELGRLMHDIRCTKLAEMHETPLKKIAGILKEPVNKEKNTMGGILDEIEEKGRKEGIAEAKAAEQRRMADRVRNIMKDQGWTLDRTMTFLKCSDEERLSLTALI